MRATKLCRLLSMVLMGMRIIPVPVAIRKLVEKHLEFITDLLIHRVADQVRTGSCLAWSQVRAGRDYGHRPAHPTGWPAWQVAWRKPLPCRDCKCAGLQVWERHSLAASAPARNATLGRLVLTTLRQKASA